MYDVNHDGCANDAYANDDDCACNYGDDDNDDAKDPTCISAGVTFSNCC